MKKIIKDVTLDVTGTKVQFFAYGNSKLPKSTLIVNITSAQNCPSAKLNLCACESVCYAKKCERIYNSYRLKNLAVEKFMQTADRTQIIKLLSVYIVAALGTKNAVKTIRINEAGDFISQENVNMWSDIAAYIENKFGVITYCYTARRDLDFTGVSFIVNGSSVHVKGADRYFLCTNKRAFARIEARAKIDDTIKICDCKCGACGICSSREFKGKVYVKQH